MKKCAIAAAALLAACNSTPPELLPPPFGPNGTQPARLFFPTGLAKTPDGTLLVANGNFNHAFDSGTVVSISRAYLDSKFRLGLDCDVPTPDPQCTPQIPADSGAVLIGNYAGPLALSDDGTAAYTGSRDSGRLNALRVDAGGALHCAPGAGDDTKKDCRKGLIDLTSAGVDGPYTILPGTTVIPGTSAPQPVFFVSSVVPHIDDISSGILTTSSSVAVLTMYPGQNPSPLLYSMRASSRFVANGAGVGPMAFDNVRRQLYLGGCYLRSSSFGAGEPGSGLCGGVTTNYLRILNVDSKDAVDPLLIDLHGDVLSIDTVQLLLGDPDPVTQAPTTLWATMRRPDSLVRIELPALPSIAPRVRKVIPMPVAPADMIRIARPSASDLLAVVAEKINSVVIIDTATEQVVAQVGRLGDSPFMIKEVDCPSDAIFSGSACLATSVFGACRVALIEVPKSQPSKTVLRALAGSCPP
jgi:YVTN family beta-propeller protein